MGKIVKITQDCKLDGMLLAVKYVSSIQQGRLIFPKVNVFHKRNH
jgi:hypothetical protein